MSGHPGAAHGRATTAPGIGRWLVPTLTIIVMLMLPVSGYWVHQRSTTDLEEKAYDNLQSIARLKVVQVERWLAERSADARISSTGIIRSTVLRWLRNPNDELQRAALQAHCMQLREGYHYRDIMLTTPDGRLLLSLDPSLMEMEDDSARLARVAATSGTVVFGDLFRCERGEQIHLDVAAPITDEDGVATAVVLLRADPDEMLFPLIQSWPGVSRTAETLLARRDGDDALVLNQLRHSPEPALTVRVPLGETGRSVVQAALGRTGFFRGQDYRGVDVVAMILPVQGMSWSMIAKVDADEVFAELAFHNKAILVMVVLGVLTAAGVGLLLHSRGQRTLALGLLDAERARRETGRRLDALLGNLTGMAFRCANDRDWTMEFVSAGCERLTGHPPGDLLRNAAVSYASLIHPDDREMVWTRVRAAMHDATQYDVSYRIVHRSGDIRWVSESAVGVFDDSGALDAIEGYVQDVTETRLAEEQLRMHRAHLEELVAARTAELEAANAYNRGLLEASIDALSTLAPDGTITDVNLALEELTGVPRHALVGANIAPFFTEPDRAMAGLAQVFREGVVRDFELVMRRRDGREIPVLYNAAVYHDAEGKVAGVLAAARDITEIKKSESEIIGLNRSLAERTADLEAVNRELEAFSYSVSHDLKSPLRSVDGFARFLEEDYADKLDDEGRRLIRVICDSAHEMSQLIDDLLTFSRLTHREMRMGPLDMDAVARQAWERVEPDCAGRAVDLRIAPMPEACGDLGTVREVLVNLLANAAKFTRARAGRAGAGGIRHAPGGRLPAGPARAAARAPRGVLRARQRRRVRHGLPRQALPRLPAAAPCAGLRGDGHRPGPRPAHHPVPPRTRVGVGRSGPGRDVLLHFAEKRIIRSCGVIRDGSPAGSPSRCPAGT